jgi:hypothetical protein
LPDNHYPGSQCGKFTWHCCCAITGVSDNLRFELNLDVSPLLRYGLIQIDQMCDQEITETDPERGIGLQHGHCNRCAGKIVLPQTGGSLLGGILGDHIPVMRRLDLFLACRRLSRGDGNFACATRSKKRHEKQIH